MTDSKLVTLLKSLTETEFKEFEKFTASPYFSKDRDLIPLLNALKPFYPDFKGEKLTVEFLFENIYPGKQFAGKKSYNIIKTQSSRLFKLCKDFLIQQGFKDDPALRDYYLLNQLRKKKMYKEFDRECRTIASKNRLFEKQSFVRSYLVSSVLMETALEKDEFDNAFEQLLTMSENAVAAALISCFKFEDEKNIAAMYNLNLRPSLMNDLNENMDAGKIMKQIEKSNGRFVPFIKIYYMIYRMNKDRDNLDNYFETKKLLEESFPLLDRQENHELWNTMLTYCNTKNFTEHDDLFRAEIHYINKKMIELGIYKRFEDEDFHIILFRNIVMTAIMMKDFQWLENFIYKYSPELHIDHREYMKSYSLASLSFVKKEYLASLEYLTRIKYDLFLYKHDVKRLQLQIYYELNYTEELLSLIDTLQHYLKNTGELSQVHKDGHIVFVKHLKELLRLKHKAVIETDEIEYLEKALVRDTKSPSGWLKEKIEELKVRR